MIQRRAPSSSVRHFFGSESAGGGVVILAAAAALVVATSPLSRGYSETPHREVWSLNKGGKMVHQMLSSHSAQHDNLAGSLVRAIAAIFMTSAMVGYTCSSSTKSASLAWKCIAMAAS